VCDRGIEVAERLGEPPVQYPTIRSYAYTDLGRFDDAAASLDEEVTDEAHRFGAAFQQLGEMQLALRLGAHERVLAIAETLSPEMGALNRVNFQQQIIDALAYVAAQRELDAGLLARLSEYEAVIGRGPNVPAQVRLRLAEGQAEQALELLEPLYEASVRGQQRRMQLIACDLSVPVLGALGRWDDALARIETGVAIAERGDVHELRWRMLAQRATVHDALNRADAAAPDRAEARKVLESVSATITEPELRESYLAQATRLGL
jgi:tetratricopeptide (TPR) repeat protein